MYDAQEIFIHPYGASLSPYMIDKSDIDFLKFSQFGDDALSHTLPYPLYPTMTFEHSPRSSAPAWVLLHKT